MRTFLPTVLTVVLAIGISRAQDPVAILQDAANACREIRQGYYEMRHAMKYMSGPDTSQSTYHCYFRKLTGDTLFPSAFHAEQYWQDTLSSDILYTGERFVTAGRRSREGRVMEVDRWAEEIENIKHNYTNALYDPLVNADKPLGQGEDMFEDSTVTFTYIGLEQVGPWSCHRIRVREVPLPDPAEMFQVNYYAHEYWVDVQARIPVRITRLVELVMAADTMIQFESATLTAYTLEPPDPDQLTVAAIPTDIVLKEYTPFKAPDPLPVDTIAPDFAFPALTGDTIRLRDLQGKVVLLDFFYKSCYPCMLALPGLQRLHETYGGRGLRVIGLDPYDDADDDMPAFLEKRGVTYTILLTDRELPKAYRVSGYPTLFLVDQAGIVRHVQGGYSEAMEAALATQIESLLARD
jgi:peroxiredoxin